MGDDLADARRRSNRFDSGDDGRQIISAAAACLTALGRRGMRRVGRDVVRQGDQILLVDVVDLPRQGRRVVLIGQLGVASVQHRIAEHVVYKGHLAVAAGLLLGCGGFWLIRSDSLGIVMEHAKAMDQGRSMSASVVAR